MSIKMICSDIDGTLLQYGRQKLEGEIFDQIRALHDRGILFCPASGRQYTSLRLLFEPVADCCVFLCENEMCIRDSLHPDGCGCSQLRRAAQSGPAGYARLLRRQQGHRRGRPRHRRGHADVYKRQACIRLPIRSAAPRPAMTTPRPASCWPLWCATPTQAQCSYSPWAART